MSIGGRRGVGCCVGAFRVSGSSPSPGGIVGAEDEQAGVWWLWLAWRWCSGRCRGRRGWAPHRRLAAVVGELRRVAEGGEKPAPTCPSAALGRPLDRRLLPAVRRQKRRQQLLVLVHSAISLSPSIPQTSLGHLAAPEQVNAYGPVPHAVDRPAGRQQAGQRLVDALASPCSPAPTTTATPPHAA